MLVQNSRILVVDDMPSMRVLIARVFKELGYSDCVEAPDAASAWQLLSQPKSLVGLVAADFGISGSSGLDLLKRMKANEHFAGTPFLMLMLEMESEHVPAVQSAGVTGILFKPFNAAMLGEKLGLLNG